MLMDLLIALRRLEFMKGSCIVQFFTFPHFFCPLNLSKLSAECERDSCRAPEAAARPGDTCRFMQILLSLVTPAVDLAV